jgi:hypothetical protein
MDTLHRVLRSIRGETKSRRDHVSVFREFLDHLDRVSRRTRNPRSETLSKPNPRAKGARRGSKV